MNHAACRGMDLALFFPEPGESSRPAKKICRDCPVQIPCFNVAQPHGIWAGMTRLERRAVRRTLRP